MEVVMEHHPRASDWEAGHPRIKPGLWFASMAGMAIVFFLAIGLVGRLLNGDGSPFLS
jgi:hypothetical protein